MYLSTKPSLSKHSCNAAEVPASCPCILRPHLFKSNQYNAANPRGTNQLWPHLTGVKPGDNRCPPRLKFEKQPSQRRRQAKPAKGGPESHVHLLKLLAQKQPIHHKWRWGTSLYVHVTVTRLGTRGTQTKVARRGSCIRASQ
eukprot:5341748-Prymnesium_polylepis.1